MEKKCHFCKYWKYWKKYQGVCQKPTNTNLTVVTNSSESCEFWELKRKILVRDAANIQVLSSN